MPDSDVTISAEFEKLPTHKIEAVDADGGSLTFAPSGDAWKTEDNSYYYTDTVTIQPEFEPGYILTGIKAGRRCHRHGGIQQNRIGRKRYSGFAISDFQCERTGKFPGCGKQRYQF